MPIASEAVERRLVHRLLGYWREICPESGFPAASDIDLADLKDIWPHCFTVAIGGNGAPHAFDKVGAEFSRSHDGPLAGVAIATLSSSSLAQNATFFLDEVLTRKVPISRGGAFADCGGVIQLFRSILLPLSSGGEDIDGLLGATNWRSIASETDRIVYHPIRISRRPTVSV